MPEDPLLDDEEDSYYARRRRDRAFVPWAVGGGLIIALIGIVVAYQHVEQRGISIAGEGHLSVLPNGDTWVFFLDGAMVKASPETAKRLHAQAGPCRQISGALHEGLPVFDIDSLDCTPGGSMGEMISGRMQALNMRYGYWPKGIDAPGPGLASAANTLEIFAAMIDDRADEPQLIPMYDSLFPETVLAARRAGAPPPLLVQVERNDEIRTRLGRTEEVAFLSQPRFMLAGASPKGAWLVRSLDVTPTGTHWLETLLIDPGEEPWPNLLRDPTLHVARRHRGSP